MNRRWVVGVLLFEGTLLFSMIRHRKRHGLLACMHAIWQRHGHSRARFSSALAYRENTRD